MTAANPVDELLRRKQVASALEQWSAGGSGSAATDALCAALVGRVDEAWQIQRDLFEQGRVGLAELDAFASKLRRREAYLPYIAKHHTSNPGDPAGQASHAGDLLALGDLDAAHAVAVAVLDSQRCPRRACAELSRVLLACERRDIVSQHERLAEFHPEDNHGWTRHARVAIAAMELKAADPSISRLIAMDPSSPTALQLRGASRFLSGDHAAAKAALQQAHEIDRRDSETMVWLAEVERALGNLAAAYAWVKRALTVTHSFAASAVACGVLGQLAVSGIEPWPIRTRAFRRKFDEHFPLLLGSHLAPWASEDEQERMPQDPELCVSVSKAVLAALGGSRGRPATRLDQTSQGAVLRPLAPDLTPRAAADQALKSLGHRTPQQVHQDLEALQIRYPYSPHPWAFDGELYLWEGRLDEAERAFREGGKIVKARWCFVGRGAVHSLRGEWKAAEKMFSATEEFGAVHGATTHVYRGEGLRRQGRFPDALHELQIATQARPGRVGAWINIAVLPNEAAGAGIRAHAFDQVLEQAPALLWLGAQHAGVQSPNSIEDADYRTALEGCLHIMRGNRSSTTVTVVVEDELRVLPAAKLLVDTVAERPPSERSPSDLLAQILVGARSLPVAIRDGMRLTDAKYNAREVHLVIETSTGSFRILLLASAMARGQGRATLSQPRGLTPAQHRLARKMVASVQRSLTRDKQQQVVKLLADGA